MFEQRGTRWAFADLRRQIQKRLKNMSGKYLIAVVVLWMSRNAQGQCAGQWAEGLSTLPGLDGYVYAMTVFNDGGGDALYVGGSFSIAGDTVVAHIAKFDGTRWSALGLGMNGHVSSLTVFDDGCGPVLYAGGKFTTAGGVSAGNIAKWDGSSWSALGSGIIGGTSPDIYALTVFDDGGGPALYAGGKFTTAGGLSVSNIAKWDGASWSALGSGVSAVNAYVGALTVFDDGGGPALYAGGYFATAGGVSAKYIAKWDGANWSALGSGINSSVYALTVFDDGGGPVLYAGLKFSSWGTGGMEGGVHTWNGSTWSRSNDILFPSDIHALTVFDDGGGPTLYAVGVFQEPLGAYSFSFVARSNLGKPESDGEYFEAMDGGSALAVFDDGGGPALYAGASFNLLGTVSANGIAKWDGSDWSALGSVMNGSVYELAVFDDGGGPALYAGGSFNTAGGVIADRIAKWDGKAWSALGAGLDGYVSALAVSDDGGGPVLYAGGGFSTAGGVSAESIAKWDGTAWSALGAGLNGPVYALAALDDGGGPALYAGGSFTTAGGVSASNIAKWDGSSWSALSSGINGTVYTLAVLDAGTGPALYAGGYFTTAGGVDVFMMAKWDDASWISLGVDPYQENGVTVLTVFDDGGGPTLLAGSQSFSEMGLDFSYVTGVDGASSQRYCWILGAVYALTVFDDGGGPGLYAGGNFSNYGGSDSVNNIDKCNGAAPALGSGTNGSVSALTVFDDGDGPALYAGGNFTRVGGNGFAHFARWSTHTETDISGFAAGMTGPTASPGCKTYDFDCDGDVDLHDYPRFLHHFERE